MKKLLSITLSIIIVLSIFTVISTASAKAKEYKSKHCVYILDSKGNATITGHYGKIPNRYWIIPSKLKGHKVTKIGFTDGTYGGYDLIKIPKTVTSINKSLYTAILNDYLDDWSATGAVRLVCYKDSYAYQYAHKYKIDYIISGDNKTCGDLNHMILDYGYKMYNSKGQVVNKDWRLTNKVYTGKERKSTFTIKKGKYTLKNGRDYTVKYINDYTVGTARVVIKGKGNYWGIIAIDYDIIPPQAKLNSVTKSSDDTVEIEIEYDDRYHGFGEIVQYSTDKTFKTKETKDTEELPLFKILSGLEKGKKYYFRVRYYLETAKTCPLVWYLSDDYYIGTGGLKTYYGKWSEVKSITL